MSNQNPLKKQIAHYRLENALGSGQFGTVYLASKKNCQQQFAVKVIYKNKLNQQFQKRIEKERKNQASIPPHDNVLRLYESLVTNESINIVMEACNGGDLKKYIDKFHNKIIPENHFQPLASQILSGLKLLAENRIIHRDIKPDNILLQIQDNQITLKIAQFGISKKLKEGKMAKRKCGTPFYSSPELLLGQGYDFKADL